VAVVCLESVEDEGERRRLRQKLESTHAVVDISRQQVGGCLPACLPALL
jgi:hypothetical protein